MSKTLIIIMQLTKIGTQLPYFSITVEERTEHRLRSFGCMHKEILEAYPELSDLVTMHLSDINGVPTHAIENGWYWLAPSLELPTVQYKHADKSEAFDFFCNHCRIPLHEGRKIQDAIYENYERHDTSTEDAKAVWVEICESMKPRWKREANELIKKYNLKVVQRRQTRFQT